MNVDTIIIGGGITGLAAAHELHQHGVDFVLLEAEQRLGGKVAGAPVLGSGLDFQVDCAADGFLVREPEMTELCVELGLEDDLVSPASGGAFLWLNGLHPLPQSVLGVPLEPDDLVGGGLISPEGLDDLRTRAFANHECLVGDATVGEVVRERAGDEVFERLVDPLLGGINAGNSENLSICAGAKQLADAARKGGPFIPGLRDLRSVGASGPVFAGVRGGSQRIIDALAQELNEQIRTGCAAQALMREGRKWGVVTNQGDFWAKHVIVTTPGFVSAPLIEPYCGEAADLLATLPYADVGVVTFVVERDHVASDLNGSGFLVPRQQGLLMTACSWTSTKWHHYNDGKHAILRVSVGRIDEEHWSHLSEEALISVLHQELEMTIGLEGKAATRVSRWHKSLPQYSKGHLDRCDVIDEALARHTPGLSVAGASMRGLGLPACVRQGRKHAKSQQP